MILIGLEYMQVRFWHVSRFTSSCVSRMRHRSHVRYFLFFAKEITSRQKGKDSQPKEEPHGKREKTHRKRKNLTAKRKRLTAKEKTSRWGYFFCPEVILFAVRFFLFPWVVFFFPWGFSFAVSRFIFAVGFFLWPWVFSFLLRGSSFCREVISLAVTVVGHCTYWFGKI